MFGEKLIMGYNPICNEPFFMVYFYKRKPEDELKYMVSYADLILKTKRISWIQKVYEYQRNCILWDRFSDDFEMVDINKEEWKRYETMLCLLETRREREPPETDEVKYYLS